MTTSGTPVRVRLDDKRRTTLPPALLAAAGVAPGADLVARVEGPGRIVLEASASILGRLQDAVRAGKAAQHAEVEAEADAVAGPGEDEALSLVDQLLAERTRDPSLTRPEGEPDFDLARPAWSAAEVGGPGASMATTEGEAPAGAAPRP